ncbi:hypothetical protein AH78_13960 [Salmonella enterica subsp. enterica serovar Tennessee]|nr:hypothetical protein AH78_13960 [Salmonella enterica subsp. enterica serovar Tennessee]
MRICRLDGVNGHQGHSRGGKAVILSDQVVKANDCERIFLIFKKDKCTFLYNFLSFFLLKIHAEDSQRAKKLTQEMICAHMSQRTTGALNV